MAELNNDHTYEERYKKVLQDMEKATSLTEQVEVTFKHMASIGEIAYTAAKVSNKTTSDFLKKIGVIKKI